MKDKINVAELLKDCPKGMELDCTMFINPVILEEVNLGTKCPIFVKTINGDFLSLTEYGQYHNTEDSKCLIFPKGKTTWEGFVPPCKFKDGDILFVDGSDKEGDNRFQYIFILNLINKYGKWYAYCDLRGGDSFRPEKTWLIDNNYQPRFATEEEKAKLFQAIKDNGYNWNAETKTLEKLFPYNIGTKVWVKSDKEHKHIHTIVGISRNSFGNLEYEVKEEKTGIIVHYPKDLLIPITTKEPNFKVGDRIEFKYHERSPELVVKVKDNGYILSSGRTLMFQDENSWELCTGKFDITTLKPFDEVLVRSSTLDKWRIQLFEKYNETCKFPFMCMGYNRYKQCIPYEGNEHLFDTTDDCDEFYKTWE